MKIYDIVFGTDGGQVCCCFHPELKPSAGIGPNGEYHCFVCGKPRDAHDSVGFIRNYFDVHPKTAQVIHNRLDNLSKYTYTQNPVTIEQRTYLNNCGIKDNIIDKYMFCASNGKLYFKHTFNGVLWGTTWFNAPTLSTYNASEPKYKYNIIKGGLCAPYDDVVKYKTLFITEGEKDMLTAKSFGMLNAVAKVGGANTTLVGGINFEGKRIIICYDCDSTGREGAVKDADMLVSQYGCQVKVLDLGLQDKEDLNDYFMKYGHTYQDLEVLIRSTPLHVLSATATLSKMERLVEGLSEKEKDELRGLLNDEGTAAGHNKEEN